MTSKNQRTPKPHANQSITAKSLITLALLLTLATLIIGFACSFAGHYKIPLGPAAKPWQWEIWSSTIWHIRIYRLLAAAAVGTALAIGGMALQGLMRNPLAEPYILGISSGAGVGVLLGSAIATAGTLPAWATEPAFAMIGATLTAAIVYAIAQKRGRLDPYVLLLSGVIVNVFNGAIILVILQFVQQTEIIRFVGWGMGQIPESLWAKPALLITAWAMILAGATILFLRGAAFNTLGLGDDVAASSGVSVHYLRVETFLVIALMTSAAVALAGPVGFVGLIIPHTCRMITGPDHRKLAVVSAFAGAAFLMAADTLCRILGEALNLGELPVGVITALIGGPFFIILLRKKQTEGAL